MNKRALEKLIAAVEAGEWITVEMVEVVIAKWGTLVMASYDGSLDAAKAMHEAQLGVQRVELFGPVAGGGWGCNLLGKGIDTVFHKDPASAWLLAILRAKLMEATDAL